MGVTGTLAQLQTLDHSALTVLVRKALESPVAEISTWQVQPLGDLLNLTTSGLYRVSGSADDLGTARSWSLVLKVVSAPTDAQSDEWRREPLAYLSGLLTHLPGDLLTPHCFGVVEHPQSNSYWIWLEDIADDYAGHWPLARYELAARHLGRFNGTYLVSETLPSYTWLRRGGMGVHNLDFGASLSVVQDPKTWAHPLVRQAFPVPIADRLYNLLLQGERLQEGLHRLPQTLCHLDAAYFNLFARRDAQGRDQTVAIDWASIGLGALGEEISVLIWPSLTEFHVDLADATRLEDAVFAGYLEGLNDAGWDGDARLVRFGAIAHAVLRWCCFPQALWLALHAEQSAHLEQFFGRPIAAIIEQWAAVTYVLLERLDEVKGILDSR